MRSIPGSRIAGTEISSRRSTQPLSLTGRGSQSCRGLVVLGIKGKRKGSSPTFASKLAFVCKPPSYKDTARGTG